VPAARLARTLSKDLAFGLEYYTALGRPGSFLPFEQQAAPIVRGGRLQDRDVDVDFGLGYGLTPGSDRLVAKTILTYALPVAASRRTLRGMKTPPTMKAAMQQSSAGPKC